MPTRARATEQSVNPIRKNHDEGHEKQSEQDQIELRCPRPQQFGQQGQKGGAQYRTTGVIAASDNGHRENGEGHDGIEDLLRLEIAGPQCHQSANRTRNCG